MSEPSQRDLTPPVAGSTPVGEARAPAQAAKASERPLKPQEKELPPLGGRERLWYAVLGVLAYLPLWVWRALGAALGSLLYWAIPRRRHVALVNLALCFPEWSEAERAEFFCDSDPELFEMAYIECEAKPASVDFFMPEVGDYVATMPGKGEVVMFYVHDYHEDDSGRHCVLIRDVESLA